MKQILVDTDILIDHLTTKEKESYLMKLMLRYDCFTTVINATEVYEFAGITNKIYADQMLYGFKVLGIHSRYADKIAEIIENSKKNIKIWNLRDAIVVMMAIQNRLVLATFNEEKYLNYNNVKILKIKKWGENLILGRVIGTVWATRKDENLVGAKFLIVRQINLDYSDTKNFVVAVDSVGAGVGEVVLVATGSSARQTTFTKNKPIDAVIMAIVDKIDIVIKEEKLETAKN